MSARLPIPAVGTEEYRMWRRGEGPYAPQPADPSFRDLGDAFVHKLDDLGRRIAALPDPEPEPKPARRVPEPVARDPNRLSPDDFATYAAYLEAWMESPEYRAARTPDAVADREALRLEHAAEAVRDARQADAIQARRKNYRTVRATVGAR